MKIAQVSYSATNTTVWVRLKKAMEAHGVKFQLYAVESPLKNVTHPKKESAIHYNLRKYKRKVFQKIYPYKMPSGGLLFSSVLFTRNINDMYSFKEDIVHLHWLGNISINSLKKIKQPIVWTLHDTWAVTGGCHYNLDCDKWITGCEYCFQINSNVSSLFFKKKKKVIQRLNNLTIITPSQWLGEMVKKSPVFAGKRIEVIPNCIDTSVFRPMDKDKARKKLHIPLEKKVIIFGAVNAINVSIKGFDLLCEALAILKKENIGNIHLVVFGANRDEKIENELAYDVTFLGILYSEEELSLAYNCADIFVGPSRQDNLPGTFIEAAACGLPAVGFKVGGVPEICIHNETGYIASPFDVTDLAKGIQWLFEDEQNRKRLAKNAREKAVKDYSFEVIARKHISLYEDLVRQRK